MKMVQADAVPAVTDVCSLAVMVQHNPTTFLFYDFGIVYAHSIPTRLRCYDPANQQAFRNDCPKGVEGVERAPLWLDVADGCLSRHARLTPVPCSLDDNTTSSHAMKSGYIKRIGGADSSIRSNKEILPAQRNPQPATMELKNIAIIGVSRKPRPLPSTP